MTKVRKGKELGCMVNGDDNDLTLQSTSGSNGLFLEMVIFMEDALSCTYGH